MDKNNLQRVLSVNKMQKKDNRPPREAEKLPIVVKVREDAVHVSVLNRRIDALHRYQESLCNLILLISKQTTFL